jgi:hypothetical protein
VLQREHRVVSTEPPPDAAHYWAAVEHLWSERAAQERARIHKEHHAALARLEDDYFIKHTLSSEDYRSRYTQQHERTRQQLEAAEALRSHGALGEFMKAACAAAEGALAEFWDRQLREWEREFPLPSDGGAP